VKGALSSPSSPGTRAPFALAAAECGKSLQGTLRIGSPCVDNRECVDGARCDDTNCPGTCIEDTSPPPLQLGAPCQPGYGYCEALLTCDPSTQTCRHIRDVYQSRGYGESCASLDYCQAGLTCDYYDEVCVPFAEAGADCSGIQCEASFYCNCLIGGESTASETCAERLPEGSDCDCGAQCSNLYCTDYVCKNPSLLGQACSEHLSCASTFCNDSGVGALQPQCHDPYDLAGTTTLQEPRSRLGPRALRRQRHQRQPSSTSLRVPRHRLQFLCRTKYESRLRTPDGAGRNGGR
jgi:hypothetical protein